MKEQIFNELSKYEYQLTTAQRDYVRAMSSKSLSELDSIYQELFNQKSRLTNGCGHCVLTDMKRLAKEYFSYKEKMELKEKLESKDDDSQNLLVNTSEQEQELTINPELFDLSVDTSEQESETVIVEVNDLVDNEPEPKVVTDCDSKDKDNKKNKKATNKVKKN